MSHRHTTKWVIGCALAAVLLLWLAYSQLAQRSFDWALAASSFRRNRPAARLDLCLDPTGIHPMVCPE